MDLFSATNYYRLKLPIPIVARDKYGNRIRRGGDKFGVFCDYSDENERHSLKGEILDRGDGRHEVKVKFQQNVLKK